MRPATAAAASRKDALERRLVLACRQGDARAEERLFRAYERVFVLYASGWEAEWLERGDLVQIARVGFWDAIRDWDATCGAPFSPFARLFIKRALTDAVQSARRHKHAIVTGAERVAPAGSDRHDGTITPYEHLAEARDPHDPVETTLLRECLREIRLVLSSLSESERRAVGMVADGFSRQDVATALGSTPKRVDNALQRGRAKLAAAAAA